MRVTRRKFVAGLSAAVLADWPTGVFAEGAARPFGAGKRVPGERIRRLLARALDHDVRPNAVPVQYDPADMSLPEPVRIGKRLKEYISAQPVTLRADSINNYQVLKYLESSGTQAIDTGVKYGPTTRMKFRMQVLNGTTVSQIGVIDNFGTGGKYDRFHFQVNNGIMRAEHGTTMTSTWRRTGSIATGCKISRRLPPRGMPMSAQ